MVALLAPCLAGAQQVQLNVISAVNVRGGTLEIVGNRKPHFTTFTMSDPTRLVIDISDGVFSGVPPEIAVENGVITSVRTASYGSEASAIARVVVGFSQEDAETDFQTRDNRIVVTVLGSERPAVAAARRRPCPRLRRACPRRRRRAGPQAEEEGPGRGGGGRGRAGPGRR